MGNFTQSGTLSGTETKEVIEFKVKVPAIVNYTVTAYGIGSNELRLRSAQMILLAWANIHDFKIKPGEHQSRSFSTDIDGTVPLTDHQQAIHFKLLRADTSEDIEWKVDWTVR